MTHPEEKKISLLKRVVNRLRRKRFGYLTKSLVLLILAYPYLEINIAGQIAMTVITIFVMLSLIVAVSDSRRNIFIALCLAIPWFITLMINFPLFEAERGIVIRKEIVFAVLLFFYTTITIFIHLLRSREVTSEILFASVCVYLLIGLAWGALYVLIDLLNPGSFIDTSDRISISAPRFLFFSYVTLTTVGYGTLTPATDQARSLALLEAVIGQLYLAIMVARLVGLHISKPKAAEGG